jgi:hypothetical protein
MAPSFAFIAEDARQFQPVENLQKELLNPW